MWPMDVLPLLKKACCRVLSPSAGIEPADLGFIGSQAKIDHRGRLSEVLNVFIFRAKSNSPPLEPETSHFALLFILVEEVWDSVFRHSLQMFSDFFIILLLLYLHLLFPVSSDVFITFTLRSSVLLDCFVATNFCLFHYCRLFFR
jgi:hypothetical protein